VNGERLTVPPWQGWNWFLLLLALAVPVFFAGLGARELWEPDEPRVAGVITEMAVSGNSLFQSLNGEPFLEQPPLHAWLSVAGVKIFGLNNIGVRAASALCALCGCAALFGLVYAMRRCALSAFLSGAMLCFSAGYWSIGKRVVVDMPLCLFIILALLTFHMLANAKSLRAQILWLPLFALALGGGLMTKGLVALAVPLPALAVWLAADKNFSLKIWFFLAAGAALSFVPCLIWIKALWDASGYEAVRTVAWVNNFGRFLGSHKEHGAPFYYYFEHLPLKLLPWTVFLPFACLWHWRVFKGADKKQRSDSVFLFCWLLVPFLILSASSGKRPVYLLPLEPASAAICGVAVAAALKNAADRSKFLFSIPALIMTALMPAGVVGLAVYSKVKGMGGHWAAWAAVFIAVAALSAAAIRFYLRGRPMPAAVAAVFAAAFLYMSVDAGLMPVWDAKKSLRPIFEQCRVLEQGKGHRVVLYVPPERISGAAVYYLGRTVPEFAKEADLAEHLRLHPDAVVVAEEKALENIKNLLPLQVFKTGKNKYAVSVVSELKVINKPQNGG
jgi:4-amino-4-deoxy-L-arabinose transferase-like glycosyltransferase